MGRVQQQAFLWGMAVVYLSAFSSLYVQIAVGGTSLCFQHVTSTLHRHLLEKNI